MDQEWVEGEEEWGKSEGSRGEGERVKRNELKQLILNLTVLIKKSNFKTG